MLNKRIHYKRKVSYRTRSNQYRRLRTPGSRLSIQYMPKRSSGPVGEKGVTLSGIPSLRPAAFRRLNKKSRTVNRAYGGTKSHDEVRERIIRAFLVEEVKLIKRMSHNKAKSTKEGKKKSKKAKKN